MSTSNCNTNNGTLVRSDDGKRFIGLLQDGAFKKVGWQSSKHLCHRYGGIGIDAGAFRNFVERFAQFIEVDDEYVGVCYRISVECFRQHSIEDDLGWGSQLFCPLKYFEKVGSGRDGARQLSLFGGGHVE